MRMVGDEPTEVLHLGRLGDRALMVIVFNLGVHGRAEVSCYGRCGCRRPSVRVDAVDQCRDPDVLETRVGDTEGEGEGWCQATMERLFSYVAGRSMHDTKCQFVRISDTGCIDNQGVQFCPTEHGIFKVVCCRGFHG